MNDLKSISQIAVNLGVSRQAVYSKLKSAELARAVKPLTVKQGNTTLYTLQAQELIKQAFTAFAVNQESSNSQEEIDSLTSKLTESEKQLDIALHDIEVKSHELQEKEQRIKELTERLTMLDTLVTELKADKAKLNERLDKAETNISNLTTALTAAQALHSIDKQQAVIELTQEQEQPTETEQEQQPAPKLSLFKRLFRKRSE
jgi:chromosome segregation ATPase